MWVTLTGSDRKRYRQVVNNSNEQGYVCRAIMIPELIEHGADGSSVKRSIRYDKRSRQMLQELGPRLIANLGSDGEESYKISGASLVDARFMKRVPP
jgi:hypothetical protein